MIRALDLAGRGLKTILQHSNTASHSVQKIHGVAAFMECGKAVMLIVNGLVVVGGLIVS
jgi:hypothetical protein